MKQEASIYCEVEKLLEDALEFTTQYLQDKVYAVDSIVSEIFISISRAVDIAIQCTVHSTNIRLKKYIFPTCRIH